MFFAHHAAATIAFLATLLSIKTVEAQLGQTAVNAVSDLCSEKIYLLNLKDHFENAIANAVSSVNALNDEARTYELAAAAVTEVSKKRAYSALEQLAKVKKAAKEAQNTEKLGKAKDAVNQLRHRLGLIDAALDMRPATVPTKKSATFRASQSVLTSGTTTGQCVITLNPTQSRYSSCSSTAAGKPDLKQAAQQLAEAKQIKTAPDSYFEYRIPTLTALASGTVATNPTGTNSNKDCADSSNARQTLTDGIGVDLTFDDDPSYTTTNYYKSNDKSQGCTPLSDPTTKRNGYIDKLASAICNSKDNLPKAVPTISSTSAKTLKNDNDMIRIAAELLVESPGELDGSKPADRGEIQKAIEATYGSDTKALSETFLNTLKQPKVEFKIAGKSKSQRIEEIASSAEAELALSFFVGRRYKTQTEEKETAAPGSDQSAEKQCSSKTEDACNGDCELVNGVCKPTKKGEGENKEKGDKKKEEKCKGKLEPECTKAPECKWEGNGCKDFSFYLIKQFPLISSVFISLLGVLAFLRIFPQMYEIYELLKIWYFDRI
ncbi:Trypanosome variant surface glycoprotein C-terminal domain containing protein, putative [Trypanosoma equiperdum]|uniref:Trypanosome variant surface glycoprotein C-terminal domain containing protein, putative n=1 Tax=Trypanosoma equiperdum TaxID=5694 RepID=A0A1G4ICX2_TRYEQ|nr:Trypanosome variant surface glycoprotein C-terminal domain containing protein, putative [Trypanosoma equiperdum]